MSIYNMSMNNTAVVLLKPHAANSICATMVERTLASTPGVISVSSKGVVGATQIKRDGMIDRHYGAIATAAMTMTNTDVLQLLTNNTNTRRAFEMQYGISIEDPNCNILTNHEAMEEFKIKHGRAMASMWRVGIDFKIAPGTYLAELRILDDDDDGDGDDNDNGDDDDNEHEHDRKRSKRRRVWTVNGFYVGMREEFVAKNAQVWYYVVTFDPQQLSWSRFQEYVIGATTEPSKGQKGSLRYRCWEEWRQLGFDKKPHQGANCIHASAGPLEGLKDRMIWVVDADDDDNSTCSSSSSSSSTQKQRHQLKLERDELGNTLMNRVNISTKILLEWLESNPVVDLSTPTEMARAAGVTSSSLWLSLGKGKILDITKGIDTNELVYMISATTSIYNDESVKDYLEQMG